MACRLDGPVRSEGNGRYAASLQRGSGHCSRPRRKPELAGDGSSPGEHAGDETRCTGEWGHREGEHRSGSCSQASSPLLSALAVRECPRHMSHMLAPRPQHIAKPWAPRTQPQSWHDAHAGGTEQQQQGQNSTSPAAADNRESCYWQYRAYDTEQNSSNRVQSHTESG